MDIVVKLYKKDHDIFVVAFDMISNMLDNFHRPTMWSRYMMSLVFRALGMFLIIPTTREMWDLPTPTA